MIAIGDCCSASRFAIEERLREMMRSAQQRPSGGWVRPPDAWLTVVVDVTDLSGLSHPGSGR